MPVVEIKVNSSQFPIYSPIIYQASSELNVLTAAFSCSRELKFLPDCV
jgi:hypothetical protein